MHLDTGPFGQFQGKDSNESIIIRDILSQEGATGIISVLSQDVISEVNSLISDYLLNHSTQESIATISSIGYEIKKVVEHIEQVLRGKVVKKYFLKTLKPSLSYRLYINWVLEKLQQSGFDPQKYNYSDVPTSHGEDIFNILQDKAITSFFMVAKSFGLLDYSQNQINTFEEENEIKILETSCSEVSNGLFGWQEKDKTLSVQEHEVVHIQDDYYDDVNLRLDRQKVGTGSKRSVRIRTKKEYSSGEEQTFYTIKRKIDESQTKLQKGDIESRKCYEKEFQILDPIIFGDFLKNVGLRKSREKSKKRKSYSISFVYRKKIVHAKLDIDDYENGIPEFLEIECDDNNAIKHIIKKLNLEKKQVLTDGSRGLFGYYNLDNQYIRYYQVDELGGIEWSNGDVGNVHASPPIRLRS